MPEWLIIVFSVLFGGLGMLAGRLMFGSLGEGKPSSERWLSSGWHKIETVIKLDSDYVWLVLLCGDKAELRYFKIDRENVLDNTTEDDIRSAKWILKVAETDIKYIKFTQEQYN